MAPLADRRIHAIDRMNVAFAPWSKVRWYYCKAYLQARRWRPCFVAGPSLRQPA